MKYNKPKCIIINSHVGISRFTKWSLGVYKHHTRQQITVTELSDFDPHRICTCRSQQPTWRDFK